ncbi:MAG: hypothetical protein KDB22_26870 [Planctomycetales bacterium]|nr:hypothetical protein [Planctomycetales bacterium]
MAQVEIKPVFVTQKTRFGEVKKRHGLDEVFFNGKRAGYCPCDENDPHHKTFHPLADFPEELSTAVIAGSAGRLTRSLRAPKSPEPEPETIAEEELE